MHGLELRGGESKPKEGSQGTKQRERWMFSPLVGKTAWRWGNWGYGLCALVVHLDGRWRRKGWKRGAWLLQHPLLPQLRYWLHLQCAAVQRKGLIRESPQGLVQGHAIQHRVCIQGLKGVQNGEKGLKYCIRKWMLLNWSIIVRFNLIVWTIKRSVCFLNDYRIFRKLKDWRSVKQAFYLVCYLKKKEMRESYEE